MYNLFLEFDNDGNVENVYSIEVFLSRFLSLNMYTFAKHVVFLVSTMNGPSKTCIGARAMRMGLGTEIATMRFTNNCN